jgi:pimeloyl-ACP methyl ester carboxylesterase
MLGYGESSDASNGDYSLKSQVERIWELIEKTGVRRLSVIGHSMGGDLSTLLCQSDENRVIRKHVNIEGDITQYDDFITKRASEEENKDNFENWFVQNFMEEQVSKDLVKDSPLSAPRYYESLKLCRLPAFKANALELYDMKNELDGQYTSRLGEIYASLDVPQMFCLGTKPPGPDERIIQFLVKKELDYKKFPEARHWVMIDQPEEFYSFLLEFLSAE